ncbi:hypothetical protein ILFOPFJJ_05428 [Ensifer psoraleae]|uniref:hypothetical protein n=1 Tax=Sinorhizobium psoraleae TaxID=520838 RepID=UPI001567CACA|nr:hypothetical protein [Sinorhizobium psoraleae]NRP74506.1 hypothetical protein [Sinorhizobium psoraleae]
MVDRQWPQAAARILRAIFCRAATTPSLIPVLVTGIQPRRVGAVNDSLVLENIRKEVALRIRRPEDQQHFIEGLREAGVTIPED